MTKQNDFLKGIILASLMLRNVDPNADGGGGTPPADAPPIDPPKTVDPPKNETPADDKSVKLDAKQQKAVDKMIADAVDAAVAKTKTDLEAAAKLEEEKAKGEYQKLYDELKPKYDELETEVTALRTVVDAEVEARLKALPEGMDKLMPRGSAIEKLEWLQTASEFKGVLGEPPPKAPREEGKTEEVLFKEAVQQRQSTGLYS